MARLNRLHHPQESISMTSLSKQQHQVRLNPHEQTLLEELLNHITPALLDQLTHIDREGRTGYRNFSGAKPASKSLVLRRAIQLGLPQVISELDLDLTTPDLDA
jgi:hypothetical protein